MPLFWSRHRRLVRRSALALALCAAPLVARAAPQDFDLPAQSLSDALRAVARQAGITVAVDDALVAGRTAPALRARLEGRDAISRLLAGSGLEVVAQPGGALLLRRAAVQLAAEAQTLPTVRVTGATQRENATGPVVGYRATRSATATKTDTPLAETPASIQVVPAEVIVDQNARTLTEVYRNVSGVSMGYWGNNVGSIETPIVRGFTLFNIYVNGLPTSGFPFTTSNVERVEVLKGAAAVLYGTSEPGGTVNVVTKQPLREPLTAWSTEVGSRGAYALSADVARPFGSEGSGFRLGVVAEDLGSFRDHVHDRRYAISPSVRVALTPRTDLLVDALAYRRDYTFDTGLAFSSEARPIAPISTFLGSSLANDSRMDAGYLGYQLRHGFGESWTVRHQLRRFAVSNRLDAFRPGGDTSAALTVGDFYDGTTPKAQSTQALFESLHRFRTGGIGHTLLLGYDWRRETSSQRGPRAGEPPLVPIDVLDPDNDRPPVFDYQEDFGNFKTLWHGIYVQDQLSLLGDRLKVLAGLRRDRTKDQGGIPNSATTGRLGVLYRITDDLSPYASWSTSFVPNSFNTDVRGRLLDPERGRQLEAGLKWGGDDSPVTATAAVYRLTKDNIAVEDASNPGFVVNGGRVRSQGFELDVAGRLGPRTRLIAAYGYTQTRVLVSDFLPVGGALKNVPRHTVRAWVSHVLPGGWGVSGGAYRVAKRFGNDDNTFSLDGYTLVDGVVDYRFEALGQALRLSLGIKNLFDREHYLNASATGSVVPGAPRTFYARVSGDF